MNVLRQNLQSKLLLLILLAIAFLLGCFEMSNYDIWWHLRTGQLILEYGVPRFDWYGFLSSEQPWIDVHWGFQLLVAGVHSYFGVAGLVLMRAVIGCLAVLVCLTAYRRDWPTWLQVLVWLPALLLMSSRFYVRPEILTLFFTATFLTVLFHAERKPTLLWILPVVQVLWANVQGLFVFGPILLGLYFTEALLRRNQNRRVFLHVVPVTVLTFAACCASPYGFENVRFVGELWQKMSPNQAQGGNLYQQNIAELTDLKTFLFEQGGLYDLYAQLHLFLLVLSAVSILIGWRAIFVERRVFRLLALLAFGWLSLLATRNGSHFALVAGTIIGWNLGSAKWRSPRREKIGLWVSTFAVLLVGYVVVSGHWHMMTDGQRRFGLEARPDFYSFEAMKFAGRPGMPDRALVLHLGQAAPYIFTNGPEKKVFFDGRLEVHSRRTFEEYLIIQNSFVSGRVPDELLQAFGINLILADGQHNHATQAALLTSPNWQMVYYDEVLAVFLRMGVPKPATVKPVDFREAILPQRSSASPSSIPETIFDMDRPEPTKASRWSLLFPAIIQSDQEDYRSERSYRLALGLERLPLASPTRRAVTWYATQSALRTVYRRSWDSETFRNLGADFYLLSKLDRPPGRLLGADETWNTFEGLHLACAAYALRQAIRSDAEDYTANLILGKLLGEMDALEASLEHFGKLLVLQSTNRAKVLIAKTLPKEIASLRTRVEEAASRFGSGAGTFDDMNRYAEVGLLMRGLDRFDLENTSDLSFEQADRLGTWFLLVGQPQKARRVYQAMESSTRVEKRSAALIQLRLGCCDHVAGRYSDARSRYRQTKKLRPGLVEADYCLAVLNLLDGNRNAFASNVEQGSSAASTSRQRETFKHLHSLLLH